LAGPDGREVQRLLNRVEKHGAATLGTIMEAAVGRLLKSGSPLEAKSLFTPEERDQLAASLAATNSTSELLGRAIVRKRLEKYQ